MKTKFIIVALLLALVLALSAFAACDKQGAEHKSDGVYQSDDAYHWHGCTACDEHIYDKAPHEFVADGAQKKCNVCGKNIQNAEDRDEVMALYWLAARDGTKAYNGAYAVNHTEDRIEDDGQWHYVAKESWDGGERYFLQHDNSMLGEDGKYVTDYQSFFVLEPAKNGNVECAREFLQIYDNEKLTKEAKYIAPGYVCEDTAGYFPSAQLDDCGVDDGDDLASLLEGIKLYYLDEDGIEPKSVTFTRNEDGSVTLTIEMYYEGESEGSGTSGEAMTNAFTSLVVEKESYTLYAKLVVPQGKAVVMCLREFGSTRAIDMCYLRDVGGTFRTSILGETYPLIEVDGTAITGGSHPEITCSESRIYIVVSKVR